MKENPMSDTVTPDALEAFQRSKEAPGPPANEGAATALEDSGVAERPPSLR